MSQSSLASLFNLERRYARSVNLERDFDAPGSLRGYLPTPQGVDLLTHVLGSLRTRKAPRAWSITGVYGSGKSAFAHFVTSLCAPSSSPARRDATKALTTIPNGRRPTDSLLARIPKRGLVRAVATAGREALGDIVLRALDKGAETFWGGARGRKPEVFQRVKRAYRHDKRRGVKSIDLLGLVRDLADASGTGVLLAIDELGKALEHAARNPADEDLYLLQQLAELSEGSTGAPIVVLTLLHQGFAEYASGLHAARQAEWQKVQGRFEDVPFDEGPEQMLRLIGHAITQSTPAAAGPVQQHAKRWVRYLRRSNLDSYVVRTLSTEVVAAVSPLHPLTALVVPMLCTKFAQNDRSLFTFLAGEEPNALNGFLRHHTLSSTALPLLRPADAYDYFVRAAGQALVLRPQFHRWAEIQGVLADAKVLEPEALAALKTVGVLNLVSAAGPMRASRELVLVCLVDDPSDESARRLWRRMLDDLVRRGVLTYRDRSDEYRVWEGSDVDIEAALHNRRIAPRSIANALESLAPLAPTVVHRHSLRTGTLRYFERRYGDPTNPPSEALCRVDHSDGVMVLWIADEPPDDTPTRASDGRPLVVVQATQGVELLRSAVTELQALQGLERDEPLLRRDGVAKREVRQRLALAREALDGVLRRAFSIARIKCWIDGKAEDLPAGALSARLSRLCDEVYNRSPILHNELVNKRALTSQGARARRELIEAMLARVGEPRLGLRGDGPEVSMYESILREPGIHREEGGAWRLGPPTAGGLAVAWDAIETFCLGAIDEPKTVDTLLTFLQAPPYGMKEGVIPILLAAVLLYHVDDVSVYREGSFLPLLGSEHFELLVKQPSKFALKSFVLRGLRLEVFHQLAQVLSQGAGTAGRTRNATLLSVVRPLVRFVNGLPASTLSSATLSPRTRSVRDTLRSARQPDLLLFHDLPVACELEPFEADGVPDVARQAAFRHALFEAMRELQSAPDRRLEHCGALLHTAFAVRSDRTRLREDLRVRAQQMTGRTLESALTAFVRAAISDAPSERQWLESLLMVIADKPFDRWADEDVLMFELRLSDLARRFGNVEAVLHDLKAPDRNGFDARRLTITAPDGREVHRLVWIDEQVRAAAASLATEVTPLLQGLADEQQAGVIAALAEHLLGHIGGAPGAEAAEGQPRIERGRKHA